MSADWRVVVDSTLECLLLLDSETNDEIPLDYAILRVAETGYIPLYTPSNGITLPIGNSRVFSERVSAVRVCKSHSGHPRVSHNFVHFRDSVQMQSLQDGEVTYFALQVGDAAGAFAVYISEQRVEELPRSVQTRPVANYEGIAGAKRFCQGDINRRRALGLR